MEMSTELPLEEDERKLKNNLATRIMSNGVEVVVKDHKAAVNDNDVKILPATPNVSPTTLRNKAKFGLSEQRKNKKTFSSLHLPSSPELNASSSNKAFVSSSVATVLNQQYLTAAFPLKQLMQHNYIIKTCLTTYTYLTTVIQNKKSAVSTFETIISVVTTESLTKLFGSDIIDDIRPTKTKFVEMETIQPTAYKEDFSEQTVLMKLEKRIDNMHDDGDLNYDIIQSSEVNNPGTACSTTSCPCSHIKTENIDILKIKNTNLFNQKNQPSVVPLKRISIKPTKLSSIKQDQLTSTRKQTIDKITNVGPYKYETTQLPPSEKVVEKYTEVINEYSDEKDTSSVENSDLLTNEQAPSENDKLGENKKQVKLKEKPLKHNKTKFAVADLLKLGSLGMKGLSQLAPVIEKMTGDFIKRHDANKSMTTTTVRPVTKLTPYSVNKRVESSEVEKQTNKYSSFPMYIPVDELETSESQHIYTNATLHQNLAWAAEHKHSKAHYGFSNLVHESPLLNGGIPISPGEVITANSDVIVGKPAVGGPLTLAASGIKLQSSLIPSSYDSQVSSNEPFLINKRPPRPEKHQSSTISKDDDSFDLRPPELPQLRPRQPPKDLPRRPGSSKPNNEFPRPPKYHMENNQYNNQRFTPKEQSIATQTILDHGSPALLDYIPELSNNKPNEYNLPNQVKHEVSYKIHASLENDGNIPDSNPSSSENINTRVQNDGEYSVSSQLFSESMKKPFLVNIQPSRVANVLIPHGSSTALIFAGSSEPHKTGDYIDDPLPYPEPGYFGSFSIDAPQMTMVHNAAPSNVHDNYNPSSRKPSQSEFHKTITQSNTVPSEFSSDFMNKWNKHKISNIDYKKIPPPTSNQETHIQVGPHIASYNPEKINPSTHDFDKYNNLKEGGTHSYDGKQKIDKEYENHLAVPPPPPPKNNYNYDTNQNHDMLTNGRPYNQRPIFHTKPIQDMKVFLNIQHPVSKPISNKYNTDNSLPPKVTSEIYFASAAPQDDKKAPTFTVHLPVTTTENAFNEGQKSRDPNPNWGTRNEYFNFNFGPQQSSSFRPYIPDNRNTATAKVPVLTSAVNKPITFSENDNVYSVTLKAATNVAYSDKIMGSSVAVPLGKSYTNASEMNVAGIPIGTNVAVKVDGNPVSFQSFDMNSHRAPPFVYSEQEDLPEIIMGDNRWNYSLNENNKYNTSTVNFKANNESLNKSSYGRPPKVNVQSVSNDHFHNSHANFPMIHDSSTKSSLQNSEMKPVTEDIEDEVRIEQKRPSKLIPNVPTNSHGWYSSNPINQMNINKFEKINKIKVDSTTHYIIPLSHSHASDSIPEFGEKIPSIGVPPTGLWNQRHESTAQGKDKTNKINSYSKDSLIYNGNVQRPHLTTPSFNPDYIPSNFGILKQPTYPIPIRDNDDYEVNNKNVTSEKVKPVYENSEEIYDGGSDESINDEEVSLESMKIPVISTMDEKKITPSFPTSSKLPKDKIIGSTEDYEEANNRITVSFHNFGSQTEKPFLGDKYNQGQQTPSQFSTQHPLYISNSHMRPRPFKVNINDSSFSDSPSPHWQINHILENLTITEHENDQNLVLNIGEEIIGTPTKNTTKIIKLDEDPYVSEEKLNTNPSRPIFSLKYNQTQSKNESANIITSTVHLSNQNPLTVINITQEESAPSSTIILTHLDQNNSMMDIINLSPPPPTLDYNFKPSSSDETIMGMSPPPARTPIIPRVPSVKTPPPLRPLSRPTLPPRTPPPYLNNPVRTLPPKTQPPRTFTSRTPQREQSKDSVSTYRPPYDILKSRPKYPPYNRDRLPSQFVPESSIKPQQDFSDSQKAKVVFPTLISSGWLTSSTVEFPTRPLPEYSSSVQFSLTSSYKNPTVSEIESQRPVYEQTPVLVPDEQKIIPINFVNTIHEVTDKEVPSTTSKTAYLLPDSVTEESNKSQEDQETTTAIKVIPLNNRNKIQYKVPEDFKLASESRLKLPINPTAVIRPTRTIVHTESLKSTRIVPPRKKINNIYVPSSRIPSVYRPTIIESSESSIEDEFNRITPTETLKEIVSSNIDSERVIPLIERTILKPSITKIIPDIVPTHHAGNEIKISEEIIPTKTEFKTTAITLTKTLLEPPKTVSTTRFLNLTHTLTVTHTKTSLVSQSAGAMTQTLVLTNTHTSTIVDVVTEIHTQVQPTTIVETVTKHIPIVQPTPVFEKTMKTEIPALDDISISSEEENLIIAPGNDTLDNIQKLDKDEDNDTFLIVMNKSQNGGTSHSVNTEIESSDYDGVTRNEEVNSNGVSQVLFGGIVLAGTPYLETTNLGKPTGSGYSKECQPDCKASRNEGCQRIDGMMKCVCRPGFARMFPDRPCKPTYTYSVKLALSRQGKERLRYHDSLANNSSKEYHSLASATHEGINRMVMQSDLRDVFHGIHINGFHPVDVPTSNGDQYTGVANDFYVQLSDNAHETRLKEVIEKYLRTNNYSLGGTDVFASGDLLDQLHVSDFDECHSVQFHDCSEHAQCFNLRGTYTCSCKEGFADMSVNSLYPGRICSAEQVGCERCNYHGACYTRDDKRVLCECFQWYAGSTCHVNLKVILISLTTVGAALVVVLGVCGVLACSRRRPRARAHPIVASCIQSMPSLHQGGVPSNKQRAHDRRALINERTDSGDAASVQNLSLPYMPAKKVSAASSKGSKKFNIPNPPTEKAPVPGPCVMIPRARLHQTRDGREAGVGGGGGGVSRKPSVETCSEAKLISYLESGSNSNDEMMRRKHSEESSYSLSKERYSKHNAAGALVSAGFKVSTTVKPDESVGVDDASSITKADLLAQHYELRQSYSQDNISEWTDAERRIGELTLSEARSVGGTLPASTGRAASSARLTHQEANTMAERDLGSTFLLPHVHLYKPELGSDVSEFDSL